MAEGLPIIYNSVVQEIEYSDSKVRVSTASTSYEGESTAFLEPGVPELCFVMATTECLVVTKSTANNILDQRTDYLLDTALVCLPLTTCHAPTWPSSH